MSRTYTFGGFAYARASTLERPWPRPAFDFADHETILARAGRCWLRQLWDRPDIRAALAVASPDLADRIEEVLNSTESRPRRMRSLLRSVYAYLARWERRSTPFGLFAGVAPVRIGTEAKARFGTDHALFHQADADQLHADAAAFESDMDNLVELMVRVNDFAVLRGDRLVVPVPATEAQFASGTIAETTIRASAPVRAAIELAAAPVAFKRLASRLHDRFPGTAIDRIRSLLAELVRAGALVSSARPAMTALEVTDRGDVSAPCGAIHIGLDAECCLPPAVVTEAETAAETLLRLSVSPYGTAPWRDYLQRFLERYGPGGMVPVRELVSDAGLGYPTGYLGAVAAKDHAP
ncbi:hypothetical protein GCM10029992_37990 [Glycomyces albus]